MRNVLILAIVGALALAGCASNNTTNTNTSTTPTTTTSSNTTNGGMGAELDYTATQSGPPGANTTYTFTGPDSTTAGWHVVKLTNQGMEPHELVWMKLAPGETLAQHEAAMMALMTPPSNSTSNSTMDNSTMNGTGMGTPPDTAIGGPVTSPPAPPGSGAPPYSSTESVTLFLEPGNYAVECQIPGAAGPHMFHGMLKMVNVTGTAPAMDQGAPQSDLSVSLKEYQFVWTGTPTAGQHVIKVTNDGTMPHEIVMVALAPNATIDQAIAWQENPVGPPPFTEVLGTGQLDPHQSVFVNANFAKGNYGEICFMPGPGGKLHYQLGMKGQFAVA